MDENKLQSIIAEAIEPRLREQFNIGVVAGWNACIATVYKVCKSMTSAKDIKAYLKEQSEKEYNIPTKLTENSD